MAKPTGYGGRDYPDFGISDTYVGKSIITDMGELAARLGAPTLFDRTGTMIWFDQFEHGFNHWILGSGTHGLDPVLFAYPYIYKPHAVRFETLSSGEGDSYMQIQLPFPYESPLGIEFGFYPVWPTTQLLFLLELYTGSARYVVQVYFNIAAGTIEIIDKDGNYPIIYTDALGYVLPLNYNMVKLVLDLDGKNHNRLMFNKYDINISSYAIKTNTSTLRPRLKLYWKLTATNGQVEVLYLDNVIVTLDEPLI